MKKSLAVAAFFLGGLFFASAQQTPPRPPKHPHHPAHPAHPPRPPHPGEPGFPPPPPKPKSPKEVFNSVFKKKDKKATSQTIQLDRPKSSMQA